LLLISLPVSYYTGGLIGSYLESIMGVTMSATVVNGVVVAEATATAAQAGAIVGLSGMGGSIASAAIQGQPLAKAAIHGAIFSLVGHGIANAPVLTAESQLVQDVARGIGAGSVSAILNHGHIIESALIGGVAAGVASAVVPGLPKDLSVPERVSKVMVETTVAAALSRGTNNLVANLASAAMGATIGQKMSDLGSRHGQRLAISTTSTSTTTPSVKITADRSIALSKPELLEIATKEASQLLKKEGIHVQDAEIKRAFEMHPALQGSSQAIKSKLIKLGRAGNRSKDARTAFAQGLEKIFAVTINTLINFVGIGEVHAANRDLLSEDGLRSYNPELEGKIFLSRRLTEKLWKSDDVRASLGLEYSVPGKPLIFRGPNRMSERSFNCTELGDLSSFSETTQASGLPVSRSRKNQNGLMPFQQKLREGYPIITIFFDEFRKVDDPIKIATGRSFVSVYEGLKQFELAMGEEFNLVPSGLNARYTAEINAERQFYDNTAVGRSTIAKVSEKVADFGLVWGLTSVFGVVPQGFKLVMSSAGTGVVIGGLQATQDGQLSTRFENATYCALGGAAGGALGTYVFPKVADVAGKAIIFGYRAGRGALKIRPSFNAGKVFSDVDLVEKAVETAGRNISIQPQPVFSPNIRTASTNSTSHTIKTFSNRFPDRELPRCPKTREPIPDVGFENTWHSQLGTRQGSSEKYPKAREFGPDNKVIREIEFTNHGRSDHPNPHQHRYIPNKTGGTAE
ncbi:MAG TPA: hypothetical protein VNK03_05580, partial [Gammaproteobacteria bacterium]|nr:hypothetical protein [Gammaproteobacteria bacterium]